MNTFYQFIKNAFNIETIIKADYSRGAFARINLFKFVQLLKATHHEYILNNCFSQFLTRQHFQLNDIEVHE